MVFVCHGLTVHLVAGKDYKSVHCFIIAHIREVITVIDPNIS